MLSTLALPAGCVGRRTILGIVGAHSVVGSGLWCVRSGRVVGDTIASNTTIAGGVSASTITSTITITRAGSISISSIRGHVYIISVTSVTSVTIVISTVGLERCQPRDSRQLIQLQHAQTHAFQLLRGDVE